MATSTEKFIQLLKARARSWSEVSAEIGAQIGMRIIKVNGDLVRHALVSNDVECWLDELFKQLPSDACLMDTTGTPLFLDYSAEVGTYQDRYCLLVASREWEAIKEGGQIPEFNPTLYTKFPRGLPYSDTDAVGRDSTHPKDRLPAAWQEFIANVGIDHPETHCTVCGLVTWNAWRTGFCLPHFETTNELTKAGQDWLPDGTELPQQGSGIPLCPECGTNHDMTPELIDNLHNPRHCEVCGSVHRRVDPCPPSAAIPTNFPPMAEGQTHWLVGDSNNFYYKVDRYGSIEKLGAPYPTHKGEPYQHSGVVYYRSAVFDETPASLASSDIDGGDLAQPRILAENEHLTVYSNPEHLSPAMSAALAGILDAMTVEPWTCVHHNEPVTYTMGQTACELCGRTKDEQ